MDDEELDNCSGVARALERCCNAVTAGGAMLCLVFVVVVLCEMIVKRKQVRTADSLRRRFNDNGARSRSLQPVLPKHLMVASP